MRVVLRLHPRLAPVKAAVLPLVRKDGMPDAPERSTRSSAGRFRPSTTRAAIGKRYRRKDEIGTPLGSPSTATRSRTAP